MRICPLCRKEYENAEIRFCSDDGQSLIESASVSAPLRPRSGQTKTFGAAVGEAAAAPFSASLAMGLFPHQFLEVPRSGYTPPCQPDTVNVDFSQFYKHLPAIALWYLRENNCIRLTPFKRSGFWCDAGYCFAGTTFVIEFNRANQMRFPGLEDDFLNIIKNSEPNITTEDVIARLIGEKMRSPEYNIVNRIRDWLVSLGYARPDTTPEPPKPFFSFSSGDGNLFSKFVFDCGRVTAQERAAAVVQRGWLKFCAEESEILHHLSQDVYRATYKLSIPRGGGGDFGDF